MEVCVVAAMRFSCGVLTRFGSFCVRLGADVFGGFVSFGGLDGVSGNSVVDLGELNSSSEVFDEA